GSMTQDSASTCAADGPTRPEPRSAQRQTGLLDVLRDLLGEILGAVEADLVAQALHERDRGLLPVHVPVEIEDVCLQLSRPAPERRPHAEARRGPVARVAEGHPRR